MLARLCFIYGGSPLRAPPLTRQSTRNRVDRPRGCFVFFFFFFLEYWRARIGKLSCIRLVFPPEEKVSTGTHSRMLCTHRYWSDSDLEPGMPNSGSWRTDSHGPMEMQLMYTRRLQIDNPYHYAGGRGISLVQNHYPLLRDNLKCLHVSTRSKPSFNSKIG